MNNLNLLVFALKKYGVSDPEIAKVLQSKQLSKPVIDRKGNEISEANWALMKCNDAYLKRQAVDPQMLTKALPKITSTKTLKKFHNQVEDIAAGYEKMEPIYVRFVEISKSYRSSLEYFKNIKYSYPDYIKVLEQQYALAKNVYAINTIGNIGLEYASYRMDGSPARPRNERLSEVLRIISGDSFDANAWSERVIADILKFSRTSKEARLALSFIPSTNNRPCTKVGALNDIVIRILQLSRSNREIENILSEFVDIPDADVAFLEKRDLLLQPLNRI